MLRCGWNPAGRPPAKCSPNAARCTTAWSSTKPASGFGASQIVQLPRRWRNVRKSASSTSKAGTSRQAIANRSWAAGNSDTGRQGYTSVMCGIQRRTFASCLVRMGWIAGQASWGGMTTTAVLCVSLCMAPATLDMTAPDHAPGTHAVAARIEAYPPPPDAFDSRWTHSADAKTPANRGFQPAPPTILSISLMCLRAEITFDPRTSRRPPSPTKKLNKATPGSSRPP